MAEGLLRTRCFNHATREAVARCPECRRHFCRECVTEHDARVVCASCLAQLAEDAHERRPTRQLLSRATLSCAALVVTWLSFYLLGRGLLMVPSTFHEGTVWEEVFEAE
ncbi:MAG: rhomboid family protein [Lentisphaerae bacterium]|jgi:hypothetical protein|nr:rhomboid family protein [Lentisphaerota bacterium]MBT4823101.1 rhomboid family protein [Lentisphaerota bacterium]MBT5605349.1 rhomboid family protein [Lentisphaerota bacterium]MBT7060354.1 rhomboid family protein [Lentisphaerota bacterium]MBT7844792.1 rhomboid family protein [Lentisphaerota bacterium]